MTSVLRVIKWGGSLLGLPDPAATFAGWFTGQAPAINWMVVGGGPFADAVRERQRAGGGDDETSHWMAIDAMRRTARLVGEWLPEWQIRSDWRSDVAPAGAYLLDPLDFMRDDADSRDPLPRDWSVTSDSIAARLAARIGADELVLLKSVDEPPRDRWHASGAVDAAFDQTCPAGLRLTWVNLRRRTVAGR